MLRPPTQIWIFCQAFDRNLRKRIEERATMCTNEANQNHTHVVCERDLDSKTHRGFDCERPAGVSGTSQCTIADDCDRVSELKERTEQQERSPQLQNLRVVGEDAKQRDRKSDEHDRDDEPQRDAEQKR